jgi:hypothetical protein
VNVIAVRIRLFRHCSNQRNYALAYGIVFHARKGAPERQALGTHQEALQLFWHFSSFGSMGAVKEVRNWDAQNLRQFKKVARAYAIHAALELLNLLEREVELPPELLLAQAESRTAKAQAITNTNIHRICLASTSHIAPLSFCYLNLAAKTIAARSIVFEYPYV